MSRKVPDNFFLGLLAGAAVMLGGAAAFRAWRKGMEELPAYAMEPKPELLLLLLNFLLIRILIVKAGYERTGRGVLMATLVMVMFYYFGRAKHGSV